MPGQNHAETDVASAGTSELALNRLLEAEPRSVLLNIRKADWRTRAGDDDVACYFYRRALQFAGDGPLPEKEMAEVRRAEVALGEAARRVRARREARLIERGLAPQQGTPACGLHSIRRPIAGMASRNRPTIIIQDCRRSNFMTPASSPGRRQWRQPQRQFARN